MIQQPQKKNNPASQTNLPGKIIKKEQKTLHAARNSKI
jgi:hypothetical protein